MHQGHCSVPLTWDSGPCKWTQQGTAAWMPSSMWYGKGLGFKAFITLDCQLSWYLGLWRTQAKGKYQTGKLPSDLLQTYCQLLEPLVPVPAVMGECHSLWLFGSHVYSESHWGEKNILCFKMEACKGMSTLSENKGQSGRVKGETRTWVYRVSPLFLPLQLSPLYIHLWVPSLTCLQYLVSALGVPRGHSDNIHHYQVHKTKLLQTQRPRHNRQLSSWYDLRVQKGSPVSDHLPSHLDLCLLTSSFNLVFILRKYVHLYLI